VSEGPSTPPAGSVSVGAESPWYQQEPPRWLPRAVVVSALIVFGLYITWWIGVRLSGLLVILLSALFLGFALEPAVNWFARKGMRRGAATLTVYGIIVLAGTLFLVAFGALVVEQVVAIARSLPDLVASTAVWLKDSFGLDLNEEAKKAAGNLTSFGGTIASTALSIGATIVGSIFTVFTIALFGFYIAAEGPALRRNVCSLLPESSQREVLRVWGIAVNKTAGYLYSRGLLAIASAVCTGAFLYLIDVPNALTLGIFVGVISQFIPTVGTYIAGALPVLAALTISPTKALLVLVFILAYQQFENYVLTPPLSSRTMAIHPAIAFGSVIAGAALLGVIGALIALPAAATIQSFIGAYVHRRDLVDSPLLDDDPQSPSVTEKTKQAMGRMRRKEAAPAAEAPEPEGP
jgi:predicted PurR-regulated permease PerM